VTAGGTSLCVWDMLAGGRLLQRLSQHQKTVTCVALSPLAGPDSAAAPRMLSGSLDGHVKVCMLAIAVTSWRGLQQCLFGDHAACTATLCQIVHCALLSVVSTSLSN
jgi:WD40 repeat protein